jgi:hypothetical protein
MKLCKSNIRLKTLAEKFCRGRSYASKLALTTLVTLCSTRAVQ